MEPASPETPRGVPPSASVCQTTELVVWLLHTLAYAGPAGAYPGLFPLPESLGPAVDVVSIWTLVAAILTAPIMLICVPFAWDRTSGSRWQLIPCSVLPVAFAALALVHFASQYPH
ncbi:MAG TPA: hypothetical protein VGB53_02930 [Rubricoccaceae bacterium]|jgi:hypothetical protein